MRQTQFIPSARNVTRHAVAWLVNALQWTTPTRGVDPTLLVRLLVRAAAEMRSLSAIVADAVGAPSLERVRRAILAQLPSQAPDFLPTASRALHQNLPAGLRRRPRVVSIDLHLRPYYGRIRTRGIYRGQSKAGTRTFFAYATALVVQRGQTFTLGVTPVVKGQEQTAYLAELIRQVRAAGVQVRHLLLDRGFYAATTIQWLQEQSLRFVMPMIRRGRRGRTKATCTGTERFFVKGRRGWDRYTWTTRPRRARRRGKPTVVVVTVAVCMAPVPKSPRAKKRKKGPLVYACHGISAPPPQVVVGYRRRFGIETSYRQLGEGLAATCSTRAVYRLLLVVIALVLRNLWVWLHWVHLSEPGGARGRSRRLRLDRLRLRRLMSWLVVELNRKLRMQTIDSTA
jgi:hypothetical protein